MDTCAEIELRQCKYLNNIIGQDHRAIKRVIRPMLGFKTFRCARIIIAGIEIMQMIRKGAAHAEGLQRDVVCRPVLRVGRTTPSCLRGRHSSQPEVRSSAANATPSLRTERKRGLIPDLLKCKAGANFLHLLNGRKLLKNEPLKGWHVCNSYTDQIVCFTSHEVALHDFFTHAKAFFKSPQCFTTLLLETDGNEYIQVQP